MVGDDDAVGSVIQGEPGVLWVQDPFEQHRQARLPPDGVDVRPAEARVHERVENPSDRPLQILLGGLG